MNRRHDAARQQEDEWLDDSLAELAELSGVPAPRPAAETLSLSDDDGDDGDVGVDTVVDLPDCPGPSRLGG